MELGNQTNYDIYYGNIYINWFHTLENTCKQKSYNDIINMIAEGVYIDARDNSGNTGLFIACQYNDIYLAEILLRNNIDINIKNSDNETALHYAIYENNNDMVSLLIKYNADINCKNNFGLTPLMICCKENLDYCMIMSLINSGVNLDLQDNDGNTALHYASINNRYDVIGLLLLNGADKYINNNNNKRAYQLTNTIYLFNLLQ